MEALNQLLVEYPELMFSGMGATAVVAGGALIYKLSSRKKPSHASVNCWFCNQNNVVPYGNRNCWDCPNCDQYNGFQENGDYNKPIPAQYMEHLNHGVSGSHPSPEPPKTLQWVNCQMLLCRKCNNNQTSKIKQLASFIPRDDENYDEEIEAYKHHLEQTYKLCRPCQAAVEYYIKYQNRQLRTVLLNHQLRRSRDTDKGFIKSPYAASCPTTVILIRILAFLICVFFFASSYIDMADLSTSPNDAAIPLQPTINESASKNQSNGTVHVWQGLLQLFPENTLEKSKAALQYGKDYGMVVVSLGLLTCLTGIFLGGPTRLRRIDAVASVLWFLILCLHMAEGFTAGASDWMDLAKLSAVSTCCLVSFGAAAATRKQLGSRRGRYRRYFPSSFQSSLPVSDLTDSIVLTPPPNLCKLINYQRPQERKASPTSLPGRLNRALRLGTIPTLARTDSGYLFSGSRPLSVYKDSPSSDYFSLKSGSRPSSPGPSPTPSVAGSVTSSSGSARFRRPLISPARLNISGQKLRLFSTETESALRTPPVSPSHLSHEPTSSNYNTCFSSDIFPLHSQNDSTFIFRDGSVLEEEEKKGSSSNSSACLVDTTTEGPDTTSSAKNFWRRVIWPGLLMTSLSTNLVFASIYMYNNWR